MALPRIWIRTTGWSNKGTVEVVTEIKVEDGGPFPGDLSLVLFTEMGLSRKIQKTLPCDWLGYARKNLEGKPSARHRHLNDVWKPCYGSSQSGTARECWLGVMKR